MITPKQFLVNEGALPAGSENARGRLSVANIELCKAGAARGVSIKGYEVTSKPTAARPNAPVTVEKTAADSTGIADVREPSRDEKAIEAYMIVDGVSKPVGMRTVCNNCGNSITYCYDRNPVTWIPGSTDAMGVVMFKPRTAPEKKK